jgi:orotate phosphoribosyltransferase
MRDMDIKTDLKKEFIELMLSANALKFGDFIAKSGRPTPYFINFGSFRTGAQISRLGDMYARLIADSGETPDVLFGPAYKGIPLCVAAAGSLWRNHGRDIPYCFDRKEAKDHGEGGMIVGHTPVSGERVAIIEDVTTAGTSVRGTNALLRDTMGLDVKISALYVAVDRCERGAGEQLALDELKSKYDINIYPIVTAWDIVEYLPRGDKRRAAIEAYLEEYGAGAPRG